MSWVSLMRSVVWAVVLVAAMGQAQPPRVLTGWGGRKADDVVPRAAKIGFTELVVHHDDAAAFSRFIELGRQHNIGIYAWLYLGDMKAWKDAYADAPPPMQVLSEAEQAALKRINDDKTPDKSQYQFGGEPVGGLEVFTTPLLCFHDPRVFEAFQKQVNEMLAFPGVKGVALDYIGYQNYRCCRCPISQEQLAAYAAKHPDLTAQKAQDAFSLETLVDFNNRLAAHVRSVKADAKVITHIYPVYLPEPLYGNRLDVDECGQTAAWFFEPFWTAEKITTYSRVISSQANRYFARPRGAAMIGYYKNRGKSPERLASELQAIFDGGCTRVQVCSFNDVLDNPDAAAVFQRFFASASQ